MTSKVGVVIGTFGDLEWINRAERANRSACRQTTACVVHRSHRKDLQSARNEGAKLAARDGCTYLIFLDADDELDERYVEEMLRQVAKTDHALTDGSVTRSRVVFQPATLGVVDGVEDDAPVVIPRRNLIEANYIVVGAMMHVDDFFAVDGFRDLPALEDWDLFIRLALRGATVVPVPAAIYRVHVTDGSRNAAREVHNRTYQQIRDEYRNDWRALEARAR